MKPLKQSLNQLKQFLHEILETPIDHKINARLGQHLRVDDKILDRNGPITIIQNQEVKPVVIINISKALRMIDTMQTQINETTIEISLEEMLENFLTNGVSWFELQRRIKRRYFSLAIKKAQKDHKTAAKLLGVGRSTVTSHLQNENYKLEK